MVTLREIVEDPKSRSGKRVRLKAKILGRKGCDKIESYMVTRSDVTVSDGTACVYSDPITFELRGKTVEAERTVEVRDNKAHLSRPKILRVIEGERRYVRT